MAIRRVILMVSPTSGFHRGLLRGIWQYATSHGPWLFLRELQNPLWYTTVMPPIELMRSWHPDGAICQQAAFDQVTQLGIPLVACPITGSAPGYPTVQTGDIEIAEMAANHLVETGARHFAFCGFDALPWSQLRRESFTRILEAQSFSVHAYQQRREHHHASWMEEEPALRQWLETLPRPIGVFCVNDERAAHVAECCRLSGLRIPDDVSVLGVDDDQYTCELFHPPLSSIALSTESAGYEAATLLEELMSGRAPSHHSIVVRPTHVVTRASTDTIVASDPQIAQALRYMKANAGKLIQVSDVASEVQLSTRRLEQRFSADVGCTVLSMIHRLRVRHIASLLTSSSRSISDIAYELGYTSDRHIARFFSRMMDMTPQEYREQARLRTMFRHKP